MSKLPSDFVMYPNVSVGGTPEAANNKFVKATIPNSDTYYGVIATPMAAGAKADKAPSDKGDSIAEGDSVLSTKDSVIGGTPMAKGK